MLELFEFEVQVIDEIVTDDYANRFIENFLDTNFLFWGGGYDSKKINGTISTEKPEIDVNRIIEGFMNYFSPRDKILVRVYRQCADMVDARRFSYNNLDLTIIEDPN